METKTAEQLVDGLSKHCHIFEPDKGIFLPMLLSQPVPDSSKFYGKLPDNTQVVPDGDTRYHYFSLRRIIRNMNARAFMPGLFKEIFDGIVEKLRIYSSNSITHSMLSDYNIVRLLDTSEYPFSLLGKFETYDYGNPDEILKIAKRPILIIPGAERMEDILKWEDKNTKYYKQSLFRNKRISKQEYLYA